MKQTVVGDVGLLRRPLSGHELQPFRDYCSAKVRDLASGFSTIGTGPAMRLPNLSSMSGVGVGAFQPRVCFSLFSS